MKKIVIVCQLAYEYYFGGEAFVFENGKIKHIGLLDIEPDDMEKSIIDILKIDQTKDRLQFTFKADSLVLEPGSKDVFIKNNNGVAYIYHNNELKLVIPKKKEENSKINKNKKKEGEWKWYYDNGQLGELGLYNKNKRKEGQWRWYFKNGKLKAEGYYKNGKPVGDRTWYYSDRYSFLRGEEEPSDYPSLLYCTGQYSDGKRDGKWKWYAYGGRLRNTIQFNKGDIVQYTVFDQEEKVVFNNKGNSTTKVFFEENYSYLGVFELRIEDQKGIDIGFFGIEYYIGYNKNGKATGECKTYHNDGTLYIVEHFNNGKRNGEYKHFNEKGVLIYAWNYINGEKIGKYDYYYDNGQLQNTGYLEKDIQVGYWKLYYENGQVKNTRHYTNDKYDGEYIDYFDNGLVKEKGIYSNGNKEGLWKIYNNDGLLKETMIYINGKVQDIK